jgi:two-component system LytT family response regulator/two-component system response regulator LytT
LKEKEPDDMPISCIIVDDEQLALEELSYLLDSIPGLAVIGQGHNGPDAIRLVRELEPDLLFLDIEMPGFNGFRVVEELAKTDELPQIVFVTAYDQYAVKAFEVNAVDYLLKPIEKSRLEKAVQRAKKQLESEVVSNQKIMNLLSMIASPSPKRAKLLIKDKNRNILVDSDEVIFANVSDGIISVTTKDLYGETNYRTLEDLQADLDPETFWRVNRSYLVNINKIAEVIPWFNRTLQLKMGDKKQTEIPVSRSHSKRLKEYLKL